MTDHQRIRQCIDRCAKAKDERGRWRPEIHCALRLSGDPLTAVLAAAAARRIGAWLASQTW